jgi:predicted nucleic acid-binding protein
MLCLDTYALSEISKDNPNYTPIYEQEFIIAEPILAEFYYVLYRDHDEETAIYWLEKLRSFAKPVPFYIWIKAVKYKKEHNKEDLSFFDCVGYMFAIENGYTFVTGDRQFEKKKGVRFIK